MCSDKLFYVIILLQTPTRHRLVSHPSNKNKGVSGIKLWIRAFPMTTLLHIKDKMIWGKWACKMLQMTIWFAIFYTMKWRKSFYVSLSMILASQLPHLATKRQIRRPTDKNDISITITSSRNSVRVVLLIARGWRGTSLPRVNVRKGIQRCRCWAFSVKAWV